MITIIYFYNDLLTYLSINHEINKMIALILDCDNVICMVKATID